MHIIIERFNKIKANINEINPKKKIKIVAVSKTFDLELISNQKRMSMYPDKDAHLFMKEDYKKWKALIKSTI